MRSAVLSQLLECDEQTDGRTDGQSHDSNGAGMQWAAVKSTEVMDGDDELSCAIVM